MNREQAQQRRDLFNAFCDGKEIQKQHPIGGHWVTVPDLLPSFFNNASRPYRLKPEIVYRPFRLDEVPVGKLLREKHGDDKFPSLITAVGSNGVLVAMTPNDKNVIRTEAHDVISTSSLLRSYEISYDDGLTWGEAGMVDKQPAPFCGVADGCSTPTPSTEVMAQNLVQKAPPEAPAKSPVAIDLRIPGVTLLTIDAAPERMASIMSRIMEAVKSAV